MELTGANLHIASLDLEEAMSSPQSNGYQPEPSIIKLKRNQESLRSFQSDEMSMYTANENSDNEENTINSDSFSCTFSDSDTLSNPSNPSPKKKKRWYFF